MWAHRASAGVAGTSVNLSVQAGDLIVVFVSNTADNAGCSDGVNTYTKQASIESNRPSWQTILSAVAASTASLTITASGTGVDDIHAAAFSNDAGTIPNTANTTGGNQTQTVNLTTTTAGCLLVGFGDASTSNNAGTGFTQIAATANAHRVTSEYETDFTNDSGTNTVSLVQGTQRSIVAVAFNPPSWVSSGAPTFVGVASTPADNGSQDGPGAVAVTPPSGMQDGDLVVVFAQRRGTFTQGSRSHVPFMFSSANVATEHGGQDWSYKTVTIGTLATARVFWCRYNGTWSANPSWRCDSGTEPITVVMLVFRPTSSSKAWIVNKSQVGTFTAGTTPFTKTISGIATETKFTSQKHVVVAGWFSSDANTWGTLSGANWSQTSLGAQYRNTSGSAQSAAFAYQLHGASQATDAVSLNQATNGGDAGSTYLMAFTEIDLPTGGTSGNGNNVQSASNGSSSAVSSLTATLVSAVTSGNSVFGMCYFETSPSSGGGYLKEVRDDQGNRYYTVRCVDRSDVFQEAWLFFRPNITNAPTQITAEWSYSAIACAVIVAERVGSWRYWRSAAIEHNAQDGLNPEDVAAHPALTPPEDSCLALLAMYASNTSSISTDFWNTLDSFTEIIERLGNAQPAATALHAFVQGTAASITGRANEDLGRAASMMMGIFRPPAAAGGGASRARYITTLGVA